MEVGKKVPLPTAMLPQSVPALSVFGGGGVLVGPHGGIDCTLD